MSTCHIIEHTIRASHTRERYAGAELGRENELKLHVKQYIPKSNPNPKPGDVTILGAVADAFPKEMYEPLWDEFIEAMSRKGRNVRSIWVADPVNQGQSGVLNEKILGPDPSWWDHGRDLLGLVNHFQDDIVHPIIGIGHSMGACHLTHLATLHPRLLHSLVLMDVVFGSFGNTAPGRSWAAASVHRRDLWPSRKVAEGKLRSNPAFQAWDPRVLNAFVNHGLRDLPTELYPDLPKDSDPSNPPVTLQTTKAQEQYNYFRAAYHDDRYLLLPDDIERELSERGPSVAPHTFSRSENNGLYQSLLALRPSTLYVVGTQSVVSTPELRSQRLERTGSGPGGSGGFKKGRVQEAEIDCGHLVPHERPKDAAEASATFVNTELRRWDQEWRDRQNRWEKLSRKERVDINELWKEKLRSTDDKINCISQRNKL